MRKLIVATLMALAATSSFAGGGHHGGHHGYHNSYRHHGGGHHYNWVLPAVVGGALVYSVSRPYYYNTQPVYSYPPLDLGPPRVIVQNITPIAYWCAEGNGYFPTIQSCDNWQVVTK